MLSETPLRAWSTILGGIQHTAPNVTTIPSAKLDTLAARLMAVRQTVLQLDLAIQKNNLEYDTTLRDIEEHYMQQLDAVKKQYDARSGVLNLDYRNAHTGLMSCVRAFTEALKDVDFKGEYVSYFPEPTTVDQPPSLPKRDVT